MSRAMTFWRATVAVPTVGAVSGAPAGRVALPHSHPPPTTSRPAVAPATGRTYRRPTSATDLDVPAGAGQELLAGRVRGLGDRIGLQVGPEAVEHAVRRRVREVGQPVRSH